MFYLGEVNTTNPGVQPVSFSIAQDFFPGAEGLIIGKVSNEVSIGDPGSQGPPPQPR